MRWGGEKSVFLQVAGDFVMFVSLTILNDSKE